jgi:protocatechuate 3,4-dioxygenase beta subunit
MEERQENKAAPAVAVDGGREPLPRETLSDSASNLRQMLGRPALKADPEGIRGLVVDAFNQPMQGVRIDVFHDDTSSYSWDRDALVVREEAAKTESDEQGEFAVKLQPDRPFGIEASAEGYGTSTVGFRFAGETVVIQLLAGAVLEGRATGASDAAPVSGARIDLSTIDGTLEGGRLFLRTGETDEAGRFRFQNLPPRVLISLRLMPRSKGAFASRDVTIEPGATATVDIPIEVGATIRGRVLDENNEPIPDAQVGETLFAHRLIQVDASGDYAYSGLRDASNRAIALMARANGFSSEIHVFRTSSNIDDLPSTSDFTLKRGVRLQGRVLDSERRPVKGAYIAAVSNRPIDPSILEAVRIGGRTDDRGRFDLPDVSRDLAVTLLAYHEGSGTLATPCVALSSGVLVVEVGDLVLPQAFPVHGTVVDEAGSPLRNWTVTLTPDDPDSDGRFEVSERIPLEGLRRILRRASRTDDQGRFAFADISRGTYSVAAELPNRLTKVVTQVLSVPNTLPVELRVPRLESIAGRALDPDGQGVSGLPVALLSEQDPMGPEYWGATDSNGEFIVGGLPVGAYRLQINETHPGLLPFRAQTLRNVHSGERNATIHLERTAAIHGWLVDAEGHGFSGAVLGRRPDTDDLFAVSANANGSFTLHVPLDSTIDLAGLAPGGECRPPSALFDEHAPGVAHQRVLSSSTEEVRLQLPR